MSEEGYNKLLADLKQLETIERPKIVAAIAEARDKGDLSENAEYDAAKEAQGPDGEESQPRGRHRDGTDRGGISGVWVLCDAAAAAL